MRKKILNKANAFLLILVFILSQLVNINLVANATERTPNINLSVSKNKYEGFVGEEIEVKYTVTPQAIPVSEINTTNKKEIVLVIDTSGSMGDRIGTKTKINALKVAANNFIDKFANDANVKIGVVEYNTIATKQLELTESYYYDYIKDFIERLKPAGATNIGDGIRVATGMFSNNNEIKKYMVVMTDGMPTALSYTGEARGTYLESYAVNGKPIYNWRGYSNNTGWRYYTNINNSDDIKYGNYGISDPKNYCLEYSKSMAQQAERTNINNYFIGFGDESNMNKLMQINNSGKGICFDANDEEAINDVYSKIGDEIKSGYTVKNANVEFQLPEGVQVSENELNIENKDGKYIKGIGNINYILNTSKTQYEAQPFQTTLKVKGTKKVDAGNIIGDLRYEDKNQALVNKTLPLITLKIKEKEAIGFDIERKVVPGGNVGNFNVNSEFDIEYTVTPKPIKIEKTEEPKEIMLVVDTSGSMKWTINKNNVNGTDSYYGDPSRMFLAKEALKNFVDKFKGRDDVRIGLTTYIDQSQIYNFNSRKFEPDRYKPDSKPAQNPKYFIEASNVSELNEAIDKLTAGGATNIGEGLRRGAAALALDEGYKKYLVLMTDGEPTTYSCIKNYDDYYMDIDLKNQRNVHYINDRDRGLEYSKRIGKEIKNMDIKSFSIGFSLEADSNKLKEIADSAGGSYEDATADDVNAINNVYLAVADEIQADFTLDNVFLNQTLPEGLEAIGDSMGKAFTKNLKVNYKYNKDIKQYEANPITISLKIKAKNIGTYNLVNDATIECKSINYAGKFNPLEIRVNDAYILKQGLFQPGAGITDGYPGENNIKYPDKEMNIVKDTIVRLGAFIRTTGESAKVSIEINKDIKGNTNKDIEALDNISVNVYKVNDKGELKLISSYPNISTTNGTKNYAKIDVTLPKGEEGYNYYIVNYNFSGRVTNEHVKMSNICKIEDSNKVEELKINFAALPDVF